MKNKSLQLIQVLRGIAALLVVFFHATKNANVVFNKNFLGNFFLFGGAGVDIFFVLSGFIITYTAYNGLTKINNLLPFIKKRLVRIYPTYWIIITLFLLAQIALPAFYKTHFLFELKNILSTYLLLPGHIMVNGVSWTLTYELFFYFLFSLAFIISDKKISFILSILYSLTIIFMPYFIKNGNGKIWTDLILFPMNVEFVMGITAAVLIPKIPKSMSVPLVICGAILFLISGILSDNDFMLFPNVFNRVVLFGIPSFLIITGLVRYELLKHLNIHNMLLLLGEASYSLYLIHLPIIIAFYKIILKFHVENNLVLHCMILVLIVAICIVSVLFFKLVEKPIINKLRPKKRVNSKHPIAFNKV